MRWALGGVAAVAALAAIGAADAQQAPRPAGYLGADAPDSFEILPPAPQKGDPRYEADREMFKATRKLKDTPRWALAQNDDNAAGIAKDMSCALGVELGPQTTPKLMTLIRRIGRDSSRLTNLAKDQNKRLRPFLIDEGPTCIAKSEGLAKSYDYPSGHNTFSWAIGLVLAELAPDRATEILVRARVFGESRLVCGVHNMSAVAAGRANGSIVVAAEHGSEEFRRDLDAVRAELAAARANGPKPDPAACAKEAALSKSPY
jgi:acid phosphatase (class A)